ncbi:MAG: DUF512 domain-containing protein, partial [Oscillospiraceae bacterium]|nr:DUF512 domain-containing protein [Oscillospiraceae bacterium]
TKHREGLCALRGFTKDEAAAVIDCFEALRCCAPPEVSLCASDEFFLLAQREIPETEYYGEFRQLENGVGMWALLRGEMRTVLADEALLEGLRRRFPPQGERCVTLVTGKAAEALLRSFVDEWQKLWYNLKISLRGIENHFFGEAITVAGLLTGADIAAQLAGLPLGEEVLLPAACLRHEGDLTLDGMTPAALSEALGVPVRLVENSALPLLLAALGIEDNGEIT